MPHQIYAHVPTLVKKRFFAYAEELGFKSSEVAKFLILSELRRGKLLEAGSNRQRVANRDKVTAHLSSPKICRYFVDHAGNAGMSASQALGLLIVTELLERRLERAMTE